jgi:hypothetical protein
VIDVPTADDRRVAVEAATLLELMKSGGQAGGERRALDAEQMGLRRGVLEGGVGPAGDVAGPVQVDEWAQQSAEHHQSVSDPGTPHPVTVLRAETTQRGAFAPVDLVQGRHDPCLDNLQQRDRRAHERALVFVEHLAVQTAESGPDCVQRSAARGFAGEAQTQRRR